MIWKQNQKIRFFSTACPLSNWTILLGYQTKRTQTSKTLVNIVVQNFWISLQILPPNSSAGCFLRSWHKERSAKKPKSQIFALKSCHLSWARREIFVLLEFDERKWSPPFGSPIKSSCSRAKYPHLRRISNICWVAECKPSLLTLSFHHMWSFEFWKGGTCIFVKQFSRRKRWVSH